MTKKAMQKIWHGHQGGERLLKLSGRTIREFRDSHLVLCMSWVAGRDIVICSSPGREAGLKSRRRGNSVIVG